MRPFDDRAAPRQRRFLGQDARQLERPIGEVVAALAPAGELGHQVDVRVVADGNRAQADVFQLHAIGQLLVIGIQALPVGEQDHVLEGDRRLGDAVQALDQRAIDVGATFGGDAVDALLDVRFANLVHARERHEPIGAAVEDQHADLVLRVQFARGQDRGLLDHLHAGHALGLRRGPCSPSGPGSAAAPAARLPCARAASTTRAGLARARCRYSRPASSRSGRRARASRGPARRCTRAASSADRARSWSPPRRTAPRRRSRSGARAAATPRPSAPRRRSWRGATPIAGRPIPCRGPRSPAPAAEAAR